ncbi:MAG: hypothetical protein Q7I89_03050 [Syntrophales bacterium]|nr:hypothetical protein [Syntrophales bacterium]
MPGDLPGDSISQFPHPRIGHIQRRWMHRQTYHEIAMVFVEVKFGRRRAVGLHGVKDLGNPCGTAFGELQLLQELSYVPIPVASRHGLADPKLLQAHGTVRSGVT